MNGVNDVEEIEQWFRHYSSDVKTFLVYFLRRTDVDDLVQETFIRAMRGQEWHYMLRRTLAEEQHIDVNAT